MKKFLREFKEFSLRGNVMDLAVGVIIGAAFQSIVKSLTDDIISPLIGLFASDQFRYYGVFNLSAGKRDEQACLAGQEKGSAGSRRPNHQKVSLLPQRNCH